MSAVEENGRSSLCGTDTESRSSFEATTKERRPSFQAVSAPKCALCDKSVFVAEKVNAVNRIWHKTCFTCGGTGSDGGCKKVLSLNAYLDHGEDPFCKPCHSKLFGPTGFHGGMATSIVNTTSSPPSRRPSEIMSDMNQLSLNENSGERSSLTERPEPVRRSSFKPITADPCVLCSKGVYAAEKVSAVNRIWHKTCFTCGGTGGEGGCKKVLTLDSYLTHGDDPYCKKCHAANFGPKGFHAGMSSTPINSYPDKV